MNLIFLPEKYYYFINDNIILSLIFDTTIINEEIIIGRIIDAIGDKYNDKYYIEHNPQQIILPWE